MTRRRKIFLGAAVFLLLCLFIFGLGLIVPFSVIFTLVFGWLRFIRDVVFTAEINWRELSFFVVSVLVCEYHKPHLSSFCDHDEYGRNCSSGSMDTAATLHKKLMGRTTAQTYMRKDNRSNRRRNRQRLCSF